MAGVRYSLAINRRLGQEGRRPGGKLRDLRRRGPYQDASRIDNETLRALNH